MQKPVFKSDRGHWLTSALFYEQTLNGKDRTYAYYTFKPEDFYSEGIGRKFISLRKLFIELEDPTGYDLATKHLGGFVHLKKLLNSPWFAKEWTEWQEELELRLRAKGVKRMIDEALGDGRSAATSARWLAEAGFVKEDKRRAGAPSKKEKNQAVQEYLADTSETEEDLARIQGRLN